MLIRFVVENYLSYKDETDFNMLPGESDKHTSHLIEVAPDMHVLPIAAIYGSNAAGKTNLVRAMAAAQSLILRGTGSKTARLDHTPFKLDEVSQNGPTQFEFEFAIAGKILNYALRFSPTQVLEEWLYEVGPPEDVLLFERKGKDFEFGASLGLADGDLSFLKNEARGTRENQPFLTECSRRDVPFFQDAYSWFEHKFQVFCPNRGHHKTEMQIEQDANFKQFIREALTMADLGIDDVESVPVDLNEEETERLIQSFNKDKNVSSIRVGINGKSFFATQDVDGTVHAREIVIRHRGQQRGRFSLDEESEGTRRLIDLAPAIMSVLAEGRVCVIDELERSMHPLLSQQLIQLFLRAVRHSKGGQIIFTTHDDNLLDPELFRPDEVWISEKDNQGRSTLFPLSDFKKLPPNIRNGYLSGRFGGIPRLNPRASLLQDKNNAQE